MNLRFSEHAQWRLHLREINEKDVEMVLEKSIERYYDAVTRNQVAVAERIYKNKMRWLAVSYSEFLDEIWVVTAHPISRSQIDNRSRMRRWIRL